jgi:hypothetical protein
MANVPKILSDEEAMQQLSDTELAIGEAALSTGPITLDIAYHHQHPNVVTIESLPELGRRLSKLKDDIRELVLRRLSGGVMASMEAQNA